MKSRYQNFETDAPPQKRNTCTIIAIVTAIGAVVFVGVVTVALAVPLGLINEKYVSSQSTFAKMCVTRECTKLAASVLSAIDETADPCTDFYQFSCGNWLQNTVIPPSSNYYDNFDVLTALNNQDLESVILNKLGGTSVEALKKLRDLYSSCIDDQNINFNISLTYFLSKIGGWPLLNISDGTAWSLNGRQFMEEKLLGSPAFFTLTVSNSPNDRTKRYINVTNSGLTLPSPYYFDSQDRNDLRDYISTTLYMMNPNNSLSYYQSAASKIVQVEAALAAISPVESTYTFATLDNLSTLWTNYQWVEQMTSIFNKVGINDIQSREQLLLYGENYFAQLSQALLPFSTMDLQNYAKWQVVYAWMPYLSYQLSSAYYQFQHKYNPLTQILSARTEYCMHFVQTAMPYALGRVFAENILSKTSKDAAVQMMRNIIQAFRTRIGQRKWLDAETISVAQNKIDLMLLNIAYPNVTFNDKQLSLLYANLSVSSNNFLSNIYSFLEDIVPRNLVLLRQPFDYWIDYIPTQVNAFYYTSVNSIYILEGIMRAPFFNPEWPIYFQYGSLGAILGHEITHGFDNNGRLYDSVGNYNPSLWSQRSIDGFITRQQCYIDEYSNFTLFGIHNDGTNTLPENIADNGGLIASYMAYELAKKNNPIQLLPGLNYTDEQMFFIAFGQTFCSYLTPSGVNALVMRDSHSPDPLRVLGTLMNSEEFANAFKCSVGSPMNPPNKCNLW